MTRLQRMQARLRGIRNTFDTGTGKTAGEAVKQFRKAQRAHKREREIEPRNERPRQKNTSQVRVVAVVTNVKRVLDRCRDQVASMLAMLVESVERSEREAEYARRVASGRIRFLDYKGLSVPVDIGPDGATAERARKRRVQRVSQRRGAV